VIPAGLISQYLPVQYRRLRAGQIGSRPIDFVYDKIREIASDYGWACGWSEGSR
jgi:D-tagatose-1,6-bisphosphate aldolase subunit GatZ/KbaZ